MNDNNLQFYTKIGLEQFKELSEKGGFSTFRDLELIAPYVSEKDSIIELGAGYGRCLNYFLSKKHKGKLSAIEYSEPYIDVLNETFKEKVTIIHGDIKTYVFPEHYDVALWMWSGIVDFSPIEQLIGCSNIFNFLTIGGRLFIDVPRLGIQTIANHIDEQNLLFKTPYGEIKAYIPNDKDMEGIKDRVGFKEIRKIEYATATDKQRTVYILIK